MLDYIACEAADPEIFAQIGRSLAEGARQADISIVGGETAQVRDMLRGSARGRGLDLVGMAIGHVPEGGLLDGSAVEPGDALLGIASSGLHCNGYSLARATLLEAFELTSRPSGLEETLAAELLRPARIYVPQVRALRAHGVCVRAMAHLTGDGLLNLRRVDAAVGFEIDALPEPPPIFQLIERHAEIDRAEMRVVYNMGIGLAVVVPAPERERALAVIRETGVDAWALGHAVADPERRIWIRPERLVGHSRSFVREASAPLQ